MDSTGVHVDVVTSQPIKEKEPKKKFVSVEGERDWSTGPYACFPDFPSCCRGFCCIPCMMSEISQRLGEWMCFPFFMPGGGNVLRTRVRTMGGIKVVILSQKYLTLSQKYLILLEKYLILLQKYLMLSQKHLLVLIFIS